MIARTTSTRRRTTRGAMVQSICRQRYRPHVTTSGWNLVFARSHFIQLSKVLPEITLLLPKNLQARSTPRQEPAATDRDHVVFSLPEGLLLIFHLMPVTLDQGVLTECKFCHRDCEKVNAGSRCCTFRLLVLLFQDASTSFSLPLLDITDLRAMTLGFLCKWHELQRLKLPQHSRTFQSLNTGSFELPLLLFDSFKRHATNDHDIVFHLISFRRFVLHCGLRTLVSKSRS